MGIAHDDFLNLTASCHQQPELPPALATEFAEAAGGLGVDEGVLGDAAPIKALDPFRLVGLQPLGLPNSSEETGPVLLYIQRRWSRRPLGCEAFRSSGMSTSTPA